MADLFFLLIRFINQQKLDLHCERACETIHEHQYANIVGNSMKNVYRNVSTGNVYIYITVIKKFK